MSDVSILRINAARLLELERSRNNMLKEEIGLEKQANAILTDLIIQMSWNLLCVVAAGVFVQWKSYTSFMSAVLMLSILMIFACVLWNSTRMAKTSLSGLTRTKKCLIRRQRRLAFLAEAELNGLEGGENVEAGEGLRPLILVRSFVDRPQHISDATNEFEVTRRWMKSFLWIEGFHLFILLLLTYVTLCYALVCPESPWCLVPRLVVDGVKYEVVSIVKG